MFFLQEFDPYPSLDVKCPYFCVLLELIVFVIITDPFSQAETTLLT